ncbi:hypothetical protein F5Y03DRAFT_267771 [Xylaria venustula]|nr:hypothetical protein F5Y03DRAFT_267771 [Xylaria venustula]
MVPKTWPIERKTFGSKSIASRPKPSHQQSTPTKWRPRGSFRLFDLPPELRTQVLDLALLDCEEQFQVLKIFLASRRLYSEAAEIFYHDISLDITDRKQPPGLLAGPITPLSPRLHVRTMDLKIWPNTNLRSFNEVYVPLLREMADQGTLHTLHLEVNGQDPWVDFFMDDWSGDDGFDDTEVPLLLGPDRSIEYLGPAFLAAQPFQTFLEFLSDPRIPKVVLYTSSDDHYHFWCDFHRKLSSKLRLPCDGGSWRGKSARLRVNQKHLIRRFRDARIVPSSDVVRSGRLSGTPHRTS